MDDLKEFSKSLIEEFKVEGEKLLAEKIKELKESAAGDSPKKPTTNKAECMQTTSQEEMRRSPKSGPQLEEHGSDSSLLKWILPLDNVGAGSEMDAIDALNNDFKINSKSEEEKHKLISSNNEGENEEIEDAELEGLPTLDGPRKSRKTVKNLAWMKDFTTVGKNEKKIEGSESEDRSTLDQPRKSSRTAKKPSWMKDFKMDRKKMEKQVKYFFWCMAEICSLLLSICLVI